MFLWYETQDVKAWDRHETVHVIMTAVVTRQGGNYEYIATWGRLTPRRSLCGLTKSPVPSLKSVNLSVPVLQRFYSKLYLRPTQPSIPPGSVNEYQLRLGRQRPVWFIPLADERGVCRWNCEIPWERVPYLSALEVCARQGAIQIHVYLYFYLYLYLYFWYLTLRCHLDLDPLAILLCTRRSRYFRASNQHLWHRH